MEMKDILGKVLDERGKTYGDYDEMCEVVQLFKSIARGQPGWVELTNSQRESIDMIFLKIGRILTGDPNHIDSWRDIAGYAQLIVKQLSGGSQND